MKFFHLALALVFAGSVFTHAYGVDQFEPANSGGQNPVPLTFETGFVFWDGQYQPPPYTLAWNDGVISINGRSIQTAVPQDDSLQFSDFADALRRGDTVVVLPGDSGRIIWAGTACMIFEKVLSAPGQPVSMENVKGWSPIGVSLDEWNLHFQNLKVTSEFRERAEELFRQVEQRESRADWSILVTGVFHRSGYLFTVTALVLVTLAVGQLLGSHRHLVPDEASSVDPKVADGAFMRNLKLIVALATLDLLWTIGAAAAGEMIELNPIGSRLIQSPWALTLLKLFCTLIAVTIFHGFRQHPLIRKANWWSCAMYMLVGMRWIFLSGAMI